MSQEVRANRLQGALGSAGQGADGFEILVSTPSAGQGWESDVDNLGSSHSVTKSATCTGLWFERTGVEVVLGGRKSEAFFFRGVFLPALTALIVFLQRPTASSSLSSKNSRLVLISLYYAFMNRALCSI